MPTDQLYFPVCSEISVDFHEGVDIPSLFTIHNIHKEKCTLSEIEDRGIDAASFWDYLFFEKFPSTYEDTRDTLPADFLASGVFAAHFINTVSPTFLAEIIEGRYNIVKDALQRELANKG